jgi:hypothetical protein
MVSCCKIEACPIHFGCSYEHRVGESWNLRCISVCSSLPISTYMLKISKLSAKNLVSHHSKWLMWPGWGQNHTAIWEGGARYRVHLLLLCLCKIAAFDASSSLRLGYSTCSLTSICRHVPLSHRQIVQSTQILSGHLLHHCHETSFQSSVSPNTNEKHASHYLCTLYAPDAPSKVYLSTRVINVACSSSVDWRSTSCGFLFGIRTSDFSLTSFDSDHLVIVL